MEDLKIDEVKGDPDNEGRQRITASWNVINLISGKRERTSRTFFTKVNDFLERMKNDKTLVWTNKDE